MTDWPMVRLEEVALDERSAISKPYGSAIVRSDYVAQGVPVVRGVNLGSGRFHDDDFVFIPEELADTMPGARLRPGDLVLTHRGSVGQVSMIPRHPRYERYALSTSQVKARLDPRRVLPEFYYYWFQSPVGRASILQGVSTVGVPGLARPVETVKGLRVPMPPLSDQRRIAGVLGLLDDLIDCDRRVADGCAALRRGLVAEALSASLDSVPLSATAKFVNGRNFTKEANGRGRPVIRTPELRRGPEAGTVRSDFQAEPDSVAQCGDILFVWSGSLMVERWLYEDGLVNQHIFKVIPRNAYPAWLIFGLVEHQMRWFLGLAADKATTMGHIQRGHLDAPVPMPSQSEIQRLDALVQPLWDQELALRVEMQEISNARDDLMPLLLSGRISVNDDVA